MYQFDNQTPEHYNEDYFVTCKSEMLTLFQNLFASKDTVDIIIELYRDCPSLKFPEDMSSLPLQEPTHTIKHTDLEYESFPGINDSYEITKYQFFYTFDYNALLQSDLFDRIICVDFPGRRQHWTLPSDVNDWLIYFISDDIIYQPYSDSGAWLTFSTATEYWRFKSKHDTYSPINKSCMYRRLITWYQQKFKLN